MLLGGEIMSKNRYYREYKKQIRDLVHEYIGLTEIDLKIVDTDYFQRLRDIRQMSYRTLFVTANHSRYEHSLGVMHLTREAIKHLKKNCPDALNGTNTNWNNLWFQGGLAGLFHDIGHLPLSHLGEEILQCIQSPEDSKEMIYHELSQMIKRVNQNLPAAKMIFYNNNKKDKRAFNQMKHHKSVHEIFSCYLLLSQFYDVLKVYSVDFDLIIRAILGIQYNDTKTFWPQNIVISLINSDTIDMDKLDYILRDIQYTKLHTAQIDTKRLFCNMTIHPTMKTITYKAGAISVLQSIVEARNALNMYVYNHHTAVYTDFSIYYLCESLQRFYDRCDRPKQNLLFDLRQIYSLKGVEKDLVSDNEFWALLKGKYLEIKDPNTDAFTSYCNNCTNCPVKEKELRIVFLEQMIKRLFNRDYLKPLWKNMHEFNSFMDTNFPDQTVHNQLIQLICDDNSLFRKRIATKMLMTQECKEFSLNYGDLFIIPRANKFYSMAAIDDISIYIKENRLVGIVNPASNGFVNKKLSEIIPTRDYSQIYNPKGFYIFTKYSKNKMIQEDLNRAVIESFVQCANEELIESI